MKVLAPARKLLLIVGLCAVAANIMAQSNPQHKTASLFKRNPNLTEVEKRGEHWFLQRCSICHLAQYSKEDPAGYPNNSGLGMEGLLKNATPQTEKVLREITLKGTQKMPGFQYALDAKQVDELFAYLRTL